MKRPHPLGLLALGSLLSACSLAPTYERPSAPASSEQFQDGDWKTAQPADSAPRGDWWTLYGDTQLNALEARVASNNQNLKAAVARLEQARADVRANRSGYLPSIGAQASSNRIRQSSNKALFSASAPQTYTDNVLSADFSYELDLWGRVHNLVSASQSRAQASAADLATLELSLRAELASDYFALRGYDKTQIILEQTVETYGKALTLTQNRYQGGAAAEADVAQAQVQLETAKTQAADIRIKRRQLEHAIAVLIGESASTFTLAPQTQILTPPAINPGLPSQLLERRPDVAAAERRVAAANADIGVARAAYFPVFSLGASGGFESGKFGNWLEAPSRMWSFGPSAALTLFDGGKRHALSDEAHAAYDEAVADYRQSVLVAYQEVEDSLTALHELSQEGQTQDAALAAAQHALTQANFRYKGGIASYLDVVVAQNAALQAQLAATDITTRRMTTSISLVKALGGGWAAHTDEAKPSTTTANNAR